MPLHRVLIEIFKKLGAKNFQSPTPFSHVEQHEKWVAENKNKFINKTAGLQDLDINFSEIDELSASEQFYEIESRIFKIWSIIDEDNTTTELMNVIYICNLFVQTCNGGVKSFIDNCSGENFHETQKALRNVGLDALADVLEKIQEHFPNKVIPKNMEERRNCIDVINETQCITNESFENWDQHFYANQRQYEDLVINYVKRNAHNNG